MIAKKPLLNNEIQLKTHEKYSDIINHWPYVV